MKQKDFSKQNEKLMDLAMNNPKYRGFHVVAAGGKIYKTKTGAGASKVIQEAMKKNPADTPEIAYLPNADSLILICH